MRAALQLFPWILGALAVGEGPARAAVPEDSAQERADAPAIRAVVAVVVLTDPRAGAAAFPPALVDAVEAELRRVYQVEVRRLAARPLPTSAFHAPRRRWRADSLLAHLAGQIPAELPPGTRVLGLTTADISTTKGKIKDWGVFGLGALGGTAAVVSSHRLRRTARDEAQVTARVVNTAVHELGHVLGLDHCDEPRCVMLDAEGGIKNTDESLGVPGPRCAAELGRAAPLRPRAQVWAR
jgi:archaemetzincin